jgi:Lipocalin-like domain
MDGSLRDRLIGAWRLVDVVDEPVDGSPPHRPHGDRPIGLILYTPDGYMSAQIMARERAPVASADWSSLTPQEYAEEARGYFAYAGSYEVDEERGIVIHSVEVSLFPGWVGGAQVRVVQLDGDRLVLSAGSPVESGGKLVTTRISWLRAGVAP